jgi:transposase
MGTKRKNKKYTLSDKLHVIEFYKEGYGCTTISKKLCIPEKTLMHWLNKYKHQGLLGLEKSKSIRATAEFKKRIVKEVLENLLSCETVALQNIISESAVYSWVTKVKKFGYSSLLEIKHKGRPPKQMGRPKNKAPETELEKLQAEVEYLRAENAYLKKLRALVEEREARKSGKKPKPSNH